MSESKVSPQLAKQIMRGVIEHIYQQWKKEWSDLSQVVKFVDLKPRFRYKTRIEK